jgi:hypothetical protein
MITRDAGRSGTRAAMTEGAMPRPGRLLPAWRQALAVVAHPDDETFGLGAVADCFSAGGTAVHVLCFTHGEASTLNENHAELRQARARELRQAAAELGVVTVTSWPGPAVTGLPRLPKRFPPGTPSWWTGPTLASRGERGLQPPQGAGAARGAPGPPGPGIVSADGLLGGVQCRPPAGVAAQPAQRRAGVLVEHRPQRVTPLAHAVPQARRHGGLAQVGVSWRSRRPRARWRSTGLATLAAGPWNGGTP